MDTTLVVVTVLSMSMAAALSAIVWRMLRLERQRSNARVAVLTSLANVTAAKTADRAAAPAPSLVDLPIDLPIAPPAADARNTPAIAPLFTEREQVSPWGPRFAVMTAAALIVASAVLFSLAARGSKMSRGVATTSAAVNGRQPAAATSTAGLELLSLRDTRQPGTLTITGMVQNPRNGTTLTRTAVTAYTFDAAGSFLASGRALIDITSLAPGDESPFTVAVPVSDAVARYRIGFRDEAGHVIPHVDRRQPGPVAANW